MLKESAATWGIFLTGLQIQQLERYAAELRHWNEYYKIYTKRRMSKARRAVRGTILALLIYSRGL